MNEVEFEKQATDDPELGVLLLETAQNSGLGEADGEMYVIGVEFLLGLAAYTLYRWVKIQLDDYEEAKRRSQAEKLEQMIVDVSNRCTREEAQKLVMALMDSIQARQDDPAFKAALDKALVMGAATG